MDFVDLLGKNKVPSLGYFGVIQREGGRCTRSCRGGAEAAAAAVDVAEVGCSSCGTRNTHLFHLLLRKFLKHAHLPEACGEALRGDRAAPVLIEVLERLLHGGSHLGQSVGIGEKGDVELALLFGLESYLNVVKVVLLWLKHALFFCGRPD